MMKLFLNRLRRDHGAIVGRLSQEVVNRQGIIVGHQYICDTMEREGGCLESGEYHIMVAKCKCFARQMLFLEPIRDDSSSSRVAVWSRVNITSWWLNANASPARCFSSNR